MGKRVMIVGSGGIGEAVGLILANAKEFSGHLLFLDRYKEASERASDLVDKHSPDTVTSSADSIDMHDTQPLETIAVDYDLILDCLPGTFAPALAKIALQCKCHYVNLTEYVKETEEVTEIAEGAETGFVLQAGLAPGFINILAMRLFNDFCKQYDVDKVETIQMKVGALSEHVEPPHYYAFTWSPIGVATEYIKDAYAVRDYKEVTIPSLSQREEYVIDGDRYEDNFTSGGAADLPTALAGRVKNLDYKTLRYIGHYDWVSETIGTLRADNVIDELEDKMLADIPRVENDKVIVYASVNGHASDGSRRMLNKSYTVRPSQIGGVTLRAIQSTTAGPMAQVGLMLLSGDYKGPVFQSMIDPKKFLEGSIVDSIYGPY